MALKRLAATALLAACGNECPVVLVNTIENPPVIDTISVVPSSVFAAPGDMVQLEIVARDGMGGVVDLGFYGYAVEWSSTDASVAQVDAQGLVTASAAGTTHIVAQAGSLSSLSVATTVVGQATIAVEDPEETAAGDQIHTEKLTPHAVALVIQGQSSGVLLRDDVRGAFGVLDLGINVAPRASDSISEVVAFARGRAVFARGPDGTEAAWTTLIDLVDADPMMGLGGGGRAINVRVGLPAGDTHTDDWVRDQITEAQEMLDQNRVGIELYYAGRFTHARVGGVPSPSGACDVVNVDLGGEPTVDDAANLYVLFVPEILALSKQQRGWACIDGSWIGRAIYISQLLYSPTTITHEIGHQLGLWIPYLDQDHPTGPDFDGVNLMWSTDDLYKADLRHRLTLGQAYRMNFDAGSWLNLRVIVDPANRWTRDCQPDTDAGVCPKLSTDLGG